MTTTYRSYPDAIKAKIIATKNPNLFPELKIPRSTANYWIKNKHKFKVPIKSSVRRKALHNKESAKLSLLLELRDAFYYFNPKRKAPKPIQIKTVRAIEKARKVLTLKSCLELTGLNSSRYKRWAYQKKLCMRSPLKTCNRKHPNQLSADEVTAIYNLFKLKKFAHMSATALYKLAVKKHYVLCSRETWFKYIKVLNLKRRRVKKLKRNYKAGIRATKKNQILHIDITYIKLKNGKKLYLQVLMDNFSRKIISWSLNTTRNLEATLNTLNQIKQWRRLKNANIVSDAGGENCNKRIQKILIGRGIRQLIAQVDIKYSNSIIEAFFRSLKQNYLYGRTLKSFKHAKQKLAYYIKQHNSVIPHSAFKWATPNEVYRGRTDKELNPLIKKHLKSAILKRHSVTEKALCHNCWA